MSINDVIRAVSESIRWYNKGVTKHSYKAGCLMYDELDIVECVPVSVTEYAFETSSWMLPLWHVRDLVLGYDTLSRMDIIGRFGPMYYKRHLQLYDYIDDKFISACAWGEYES